MVIKFRIVPAGQSDEIKYIGPKSFLKLPFSNYLFCLVQICLEVGWARLEFKVSIVVFFLGFGQKQDNYNRKNND